MVKIIAFWNLKGGVGKSTSVENFAYNLSELHNKKVLIIDTDKQGNTSKFFKRYSNNNLGLQDLYLDSSLDITSVIQQTDYEGLDIITSNMNLLKAEKEILIDTTDIQQYRLKRVIKPIVKDYDFIVIDCPPDASMLVLNALSVADDVIAPIKIDMYALDGLEIVQDRINTIKDRFNENINFAGCLMTMCKNFSVDKQGAEVLQSMYKCFDTKIRNTTGVVQSSFTEKPLLVHSPKGTATKDYVSFTKEYLERS